MKPKFPIPRRMATTLRTTACHGIHVELGARMVDFHGYHLPIWYTSISEEHHATRTGAGLFDVSHMGSFRFIGEGVASWLEGLATQAVTSVPVGRCGYTHFCDEAGHIIDDMIFAVVSETEIRGVPNASMIDVMSTWFRSHLPADESIELIDESEGTSILALQGPSARIILETVLGEEAAVGRFRCAPFEFGPFQGWIQGTGYTGEAGFEIFISDAQTPDLFMALIESGRAHGIQPVGLGARDTLRMEKGYLLSGVDFLTASLLPDDGSKDHLLRTTVESNVPFGLDLDHEFVGRQGNLISDQGSIRWWGVRALGRGAAPRTGTEVYAHNGGVAPDPSGIEPIAVLTSGAPSPSLGNLGIGMGYLPDMVPGERVWLATSTRRMVEAEIVRPPFL